MKNYFPIFILIFGALFLFSCDAKRTEDGDLLFGLDPVDPNPDPSPVQHTKLLSKYVYTYADGEVVSATYTYNSGVLVSSKLIEEEQITDFTLTYDGSTLSKIKVDINDGTEVTTASFDLQYTASQLVKSTGVFSGNGESVYVDSDFTYVSGQLSNINTKYTHEDPEHPGTFLDVMALTSNLQYAGNNISLWKFTTKHAQIGPVIIPEITVENTISSYDTNKNPFNTLPKAFTIATGHFSTSSSAFTGLSSNNFKKLNALVMGTSETANFSYEYNADGYPTKATSEQGTIIYEYIPR